MTPDTFEKFLDGIRRHAEVLRRHGLLNDRQHMKRSSYHSTKTKRGSLVIIEAIITPLDEKE